MRRASVSVAHGGAHAVTDFAPTLHSRTLCFPGGFKTRRAHLGALRRLLVRLLQKLPACIVDRVAEQNYRSPFVFTIVTVGRACCVTAASRARPTLQVRGAPT